MDNISLFSWIALHAYTVWPIVMVGAALLHWGLKVRKGEATGDFIDYWFKETPGYSVGTFGAMVAAWWLVMTTDGLKDMAPHMIVEGAFATGWLLNSMIAPGTSEEKKP